MDNMGLHYGTLDLILWGPIIIAYKPEIDIFAHMNYIMIHRGYVMVHPGYIIISGGNSMVHMGMIQTGNIHGTPGVCHCPQELYHISII